MTTDNSENPQASPIRPVQPRTKTNPTVADGDNRRTQTRVRVRIPKNYHQEPVISRLVSQHGLTVNITAALLGANARDDGWFDLELHGTTQQIHSALIYFDELDLETWQGSGEPEDGW